MMDSEEIHHYDRSSVTHCIFQAVCARSTKRRIIWVFICVATATGLFWHMALLMMRFLALPITTSIQLSTTFVQPTVTVCNRKYMTVSNLRKFYLQREGRNGRWGKKDDSTIKIQKYNHIVEYVKDLQSFMEFVKERDKSFKFRKFSSIDEVAMQNLDLKSMKMRDFGLPKLGFIIKCQVRGMDCSEKDFYEIIHPDYNSCFSFNSSRFAAKLATNKTANSTQLNLLPLDISLYTDAYPDFGSALKQQDEAEQDFNYTSYLTDALRLREPGAVDVIIHHPDQFPHADDNVFTAPAGFRTTLTVQHYSQAYMHRESNKCDMDALARRVSYMYYPSGGYRDFAMTTKDCQVMRLTAALKESCSCRLAYLPEITTAHKDTCKKLYRPISNEKNKCKRLYIQLKRISKECDDVIKFPKRQKCAEAILKGHSDTSAGCLPACRIDTYRVELSRSSWPQPFAQQDVEFFISAQLRMTFESGDPLRTDSMAGLFHGFSQPKYKKGSFSRHDALYVTENIARVVITRNADIPTVITKEEKAYPMAELLSDFGGILGLWVGLSLMAICQLVDILIEFMSARNEF